MTVSQKRQTAENDGDASTQDRHDEEAPSPRQLGDFQVVARIQGKIRYGDTIRFAD